MKKLLLVLLLLPTPSFAAIVVEENSASQTCTSATTCTATLAGEPTAGETVIACVSTPSGSFINFDSVTMDTGAVDFLHVIGNDLSGRNVEVWYAPNIPATSGTAVVVTTDQTAQIGITTFVVSDLDADSVVDVYEKNTSTPSTAFSSGITETTTQADALWIACGISTSSTVSSASELPSGTVETEDEANGGGRHYAFYFIQSSTGAAEITSTLSSSIGFSSVIGVFREDPKVIPADKVFILDPWQFDNTYITEDKDFVPSAGNNRIFTLCLALEKAGTPIITVTNVTWGDKNLTEQFDLNVGSPAHTVLYFGYLLESDIASRSGDTITITYSSTPLTPMIGFATYQNVDQTTPIVDSDSNTSTSANSLQLAGTITGGTGDKLMGCMNVNGHQATDVTTSGWQEQHQIRGATSSDTTEGTFHRIATTSVTENPTFTSGTTARMIVIGAVLNFVAPAGGETDTMEGGTLNGGTISMLFDPSPTQGLGHACDAWLMDKHRAGLVFLPVTCTITAQGVAETINPPMRLF